ncbi:putative rRNA methyltransferase YqxC [uncultured Desulfatiglans sp.]|uniref:Putative rRNA methyltransferase YqxC n=1 Tax=Uncultured Desulfatiglans sp. TaxID=1748965 RepID=A0A653A341_UNCDX|nr:putative rRNA methyltransferase YqxC [uncultured Desulfatiglans sp.]
MKRVQSGMTERPDRVRLDRLLLERGLAESREKARAMIMAGAVRVDGRTADKAGTLVAPSAVIEVIGRPHPYVSRGGLKLEAALDHFSIQVDGLTLLDVGASTGGFTDCLLQRGAARVLAVDVGYGQLDWRLRQDPRVLVFERTNARYLLPGDLPGPIHGAVVDASFISLKIIVPPVSRLLTPSSFIIALIKPQFEAGKNEVGKGGVVRDPACHRRVVEDLTGFFQTTGWTPLEAIPSPILGPKGNREFLICLKRTEASGPAKKFDTAV